MRAPLNTNDQGQVQGAIQNFREHGITSEAQQASCDRTISALSKTEKELSITDVSEGEQCIY